MPYCIGLTGGIGSGKSTVAAMFEALGAGIVDTDAISHALTAPGGAAMTAIREQFGADFVAADGSLDRERMRALAFADAVSRARLESILHPLIRERTRDAIAATGAPYVMVVVPLLFETGACLDFVKRVLVVDCDEDEQIRRAVGRGALNAAQVRRIMAAQLPRAERLKRADDMIDNSGSLPELRRRVGELHAKYVALAHATHEQQPVSSPHRAPGN